MFIKLIYTYIIVLALSFTFITNSYTYELAFLDEGKTIKELKQNIDVLDSSNNQLNTKLIELNTDYQLKTFLKNDLTVLELNKIRKIVLQYNDSKLKIELILLKKAKELLSVKEEKRLLLEEKRKLYSGLIPYIDITFKNEYLEYIKGDAKIFSEKNDIKTDIIVKKEILITKVETIETKIREHNNFINESIKNVIEKRLDDKINNLNNNVTFKVLNIESKIKVIEKTIRKVKIKLKNLENSNQNQNDIQLGLSLLDKKIQTYYIAVEKLEEFMNLLKQKK